MSVSGDVVWAWLIRAKLWSTWYSNSANVIIEDGKPDLRLGTKFKWKTFGLNLESQVEEFVTCPRKALRSALNAERLHKLVRCSVVSAVKD
jgi:hypothetical protein